jgi:hypothetical protein
MRSHETPEESLARAGIVEVPIVEAEAERDRSKDAASDKTNVAGGRKQADVLIGIAESAELFHAPDSAGFADVEINNHRETWSLRSKGFRRWLARRFFEDTSGAPNSDAMQSALNVIEAKAHFDAPEREVHVRVGRLNGRIYLDLCDKGWHAVEIDAGGWRVISRPPVRFQRAAGMRALPTPASGGSADSLRTFLNVQSDSDFVLVIAWLVAALRGCGPYPLLALAGEQGSAKSTFSQILRALIDPNTAPLRSLPREERDLYIAANNGHVLAFDNISGVPSWLSDALCRISTGGGFSVRQLYTDQDESLFDAMRPIILNGIDDVVTRPDLADRAIILSLAPIPEDGRRPEAEIMAAFEAERPRILGALLDAIAQGLKRLPSIWLDKLPRLADFALWATACETATWQPGTFRAAYYGNLEEALENVIEADCVAVAVRLLMETQAEWTGKASALLPALAELAGERAAKSRDWPTNPRALSSRLTRTATVLRQIGISIVRERIGKTRDRLLRITAKASASSPKEAGIFASAASASSASTENNGLGRTQTHKAGASAGADRFCVRQDRLSKPLKVLSAAQQADIPDEADAEIPAVTGHGTRGAPEEPQRSATPCVGSFNEQTRPELARSARKLVRTIL